MHDFRSTDAQADACWSGKGQDSLGIVLDIIVPYTIMSRTDKPFWLEVLRLTKGVSPPGTKNARHLPAYILLFLARDGGLHGGAINSLIKALWPRNWYRASFDPGAVYRTLKSLEEAGAVSSEWQTSDSGSPRRIYEITEDGWKMLFQWEDDIDLRRKNLQFFLDEFAMIKSKNDDKTL